jgi:pyridoxine kinase
VFALQRLGCEVWPVHTVQFSNHTGYGAWQGDVFAADRVGAVIDGIANLGVLGRCDGVLSGYAGTVETGGAILDAAARVKAANPAAAWCCDPVIGNRARGSFVRPGVAEFMRDRAVPAADVVTPNHFELDRLTGQDQTTSVAVIIKAVDALHARGPRAVLVTSVRSDATPVDSLDVIASAAGRRHLVRTPRLDTPANGAGDLIAALFFFHWLRRHDAADALAAATSSVFSLLRRTQEAGATEMVLIDAQEELVAPSWRFEPAPVGG